jgi:hypothetical protein
MSEIERASWTIAEFCLRHRFSKATYYELKKRGRAPREMNINGVKRISHTAEADWLELIERPDPTDIKISKTRSAKTRKAGKLAAQSPKHHCRRKRAAA